MNFQLYKLSTKEVFRLSSVSYCLPERAILNPVARWQMSCKVESIKFVKHKKLSNFMNFTNFQLFVSYKRFHGLRMPVRQIKWLLLQLFRVATVTIMEISTILETTVTGGVLQRTIQITPTTGT